jgi:hypothetical protein
MLARALDAGVPAAWVTADSIYGDVKYLRVWLEARPIGYVLAVSRQDTVADPDWRQRRIATYLAAPPTAGWARLSAGLGPRGRATTTGCACRSSRRLAPVGRAGCCCAAASPTRPRSPLTSASVRWGRPSPSWCASPAAAGRWSAASRRLSRRSASPSTRSAAGRAGIAMSPSPAGPCLPHRRARPRRRSAGRAAKGGSPAWPPGPVPGVPPGFIPLTVPESRRLLAHLWATTPPTSAAVWRWSCWRRRHQAIARFYHYLRRTTQQLHL